MLTVNKRDVILIPPTQLLAEASTIGLQPGEWPDWIAVVDDRNEGWLFGFPVAAPDGGRTYRTNSGAFQLQVMND